MTNSVLSNHKLLILTTSICLGYQPCLLSRLRPETVVRLVLEIRDWWERD